MENVAFGSLVEILRRHCAMLEPTPIVLVPMERSVSTGGRGGVEVLARKFLAMSSLLASRSRSLTPPLSFSHRSPVASARGGRGPSEKVSRHVELVGLEIEVVNPTPIVLSPESRCFGPWGERSHSQNFSRHVELVGVAIELVNPTPIVLELMERSMPAEGGEDLEPYLFSVDVESVNPTPIVLELMERSMPAGGEDLQPYFSPPMSSGLTRPPSSLWRSPVSRRRSPPPHRPVTLDNLAKDDKLLEVECSACRPSRHLYIEPLSLGLPKRLPVPEVANHLVCSVCGARNDELKRPIHARPDAEFQG